MISLTAKVPRECPPAELADFVALVLTGGEVARDGLEDRVRRAQILLFLHREGELVGIAALKKPDPGYRADTFAKAGATCEPEHFRLELGWVFVKPTARRTGLSHRLVNAATAHAGSTRVFATSRTDNLGMHAALLGASFVRHGNEYASNRGIHRLVLFLYGSPKP